MPSAPPTAALVLKTSNANVFTNACKSGLFVNQVNNLGKKPVILNETLFSSCYETSRLARAVQWSIPEFCFNLGGKREHDIRKIVVF